MSRRFNRLGRLADLIAPALRMRALMRGLRRHRHHAEAPTRTGVTLAADVAGSDDSVPIAGHETVPHALPRIGANEKSVRRLVVLVAEDNVTSQKVIAKILENAGHRPQIVDNGQAAAEAVAKGAFDAVLLDLEMPVLNGIEAAKLIRFLSTGHSRVPIVALATQADEPTWRRCRQAGMNTCIAKPIQPAELLRILQAAVSAKRHPRPSPRQVLEVGNPGAIDIDRPGPLDVRTLASLKALGGDDFVEELARQFIDDAAGVLQELAKAAARGDVHRFREHAHALRSAAANVGAQRIYEMCLGWRRIDPAMLSHKGKSYVRELEQEFGRVRTALRDYRNHSAHNDLGPTPGTNRAPTRRA